MSASSSTSAIDLRPAAGRFRWVICALLFLACAVNYMDRQVLGLLKPQLSAMFRWTESDYGRMAIAFQATYALGQTLIGPFIDWVGTKVAYTCSTLFWSLSAISHALCRTVPGFTIARAALGLGESGNFPTAIRTVTEWFPASERSVATGFFNTGSNIGAIFAPVLVPLLVATFSWQGAFVLLGCADMVWIGLWLGLYDSPAESKHVSGAELAHIRSGATPASETRISWVRLLGFRQAWAYYGTCVLVGPVWWFYGFWLPDFFAKQFHLNLKAFGLPLVVVYSVTAAGSVLGGGLSAYFLRRGWSINRARKTASFLCAVSTPASHYRPGEGVWLATGFFALAAAAHQGWSATMYTVVSDIFPKPAVASVVGPALLWPRRVDGLYCFGFVLVRWGGRLPPLHDPLLALPACGRHG